MEQLWTKTWKWFTWIYKLEGNKSSDCRKRLFRPDVCLARSTLERHFGQTQIVVNLQLKPIHSHPLPSLMTLEQSSSYSQLVTSCVNVVTMYKFQGHLCSQSILKSAVRKLPPDLRSNRFSVWLNKCAESRFDLLQYLAKQYCFCARNSASVFQQQKFQRHTSVQTIQTVKQNVFRKTEFIRQYGNTTSSSH